MARRKQRTRPAPKDGRKKGGVWRTDYVDGLKVAESGDLPLCGVIPAQTVQTPAPYYGDALLHSVSDPDEWRHMPGKESRAKTVIFRDKILRASRNEEEIAAYWAARDGINVATYARLREYHYSNAHKAKAQYLGRSKAFHDGISRREKELLRDRQEAAKRAAAVSYLVDEIGEHATRLLVDRGFDLVKSAEAIAGQQGGV